MLQKKRRIKNELPANPNGGASHVCDVQVVCNWTLKWWEECCPQCERWVAFEMMDVGWRGYAERNTGFWLPKDTIGVGKRTEQNWTLLLGGCAQRNTCNKSQTHTPIPQSTITTRSNPTTQGTRWILFGSANPTCTEESSRKRALYSYTSSLIKLGYNKGGIYIVPYANDNNTLNPKTYDSWLTQWVNPEYRTYPTIAMTQKLLKWISKLKGR